MTNATWTFGQYGLGAVSASALSVTRVSDAPAGHASAASTHTDPGLADAPRLSDEPGEVAGPTVGNRTRSRGPSGCSGSVSRCRGGTRTETRTATKTVERARATRTVETRRVPPVGPGATRADAPIRRKQSCAER